MAQQHINYSTPNDGLGDTLRTSQVKAESNFNELYGNKVDKVTGKGLSDNNFSDIDKAKLDSLDPLAGAQSDWSQGDNLEPDYIKNKPENLSDFFNDLPTLLNAVGTFHYADLATQTVPLVILPATPKKLTNDTEGVYTNLANTPYGVSSVWNTATNQLDFTQLSLGDNLTFRLDAVITTTSVNQTAKAYIKFGVGSLSEFDLIISQAGIKTAGSYPFVSEVSFDLAYQDIVDNPAEIYIESDDDATIKINGWYIEILRKNINIVDFEDLNAVHKTGNETVAGVKTFSSNIKLQTGILELNNSDDNGYGSILLNYNRFLFKDKTDKIQFLIEEGNFSTYKTNSILGRFVNSDLTATRNYGLPDASGTIALISQTVTNGVTTSSPSQDAVYDFVTALDLNAVHKTGNEYIEGVKTFTDGIVTDAFVKLIGSAEIIFESAGNNFNLNVDVLTGNRAVTFPDKSGTIAFLDDISGGGGGATNLGYTASPTNGIVTSDTGTDATLPLADGTNAGLLKPAKFTVLENTSGTNSGNETSTSIATINHAATPKTTLVDADEITGQNSATSFSLIRIVLSDLWTYIKSKADVFYQPKGVRITNATTTGSYAIDWNAADVWQLTLTGATTITDTNLPTGTATKVIELVVKGAFAITLPAYWEATPASGAYTGAKWNHFVVSCIVGTTSSEKVIYSNEVLAT